ncbi:ribosomal protein L11 methyltransferase [Moraxella macacae 0408225]|uniref:Ribosomal protein L11 methyltransferase n=1 Tax=Moraxella macacae 0408225 TaxID=1230338 RepID=L2F6A2_9GAMM|nr:50S ribosomal protein L11 methyltransferase [Moraxella macacae]ELA08326.1 ribosomal protein L11 methyltransferase [Moraxella macacae 0408225]
MAWQQLHIQCKKSQAEIAETLLLEADALSISLDDAGDQPLFEPLPGESPLWDNVIVSALFDTSVNLENISQSIANQVIATRVWQSCVDDKDWEREWMKNYYPIECANNLWITPKWLTPPKPDALNIMMDPGLAFGTGYHATTRLCIDWLTEQDLTDKIVLDYGCGSGILGIVALKRGAKAVYAVDIDPQALLATQQNAKCNGVLNQLQVFLPQAFEQFCQNNPNLCIQMIVANILAKPLIALAPYFSTLIEPKGDIVLAGLIENQVADVKTAYQAFFDMHNDFAFSSQEDKHWHRLSGKKSR